LTDVTWPQPHEDARGVTRDDHLLSLSADALRLRDALITLTYHLRTALLVGDPAPVVRRMYERLSDPRPGDLVVESSVIHSRDARRRVTGLGVLLLRRREWWHADEDWERECADGG